MQTYFLGGENEISAQTNLKVGFIAIEISGTSISFWFSDFPTRPKKCQMQAFLKSILCGFSFHEPILLCKS